MVRPALALLALCALCALCAACGPREPAASASPASAVPAASASAATGAAAQVVNASILTNGCQALGAANARLAEKAMNQLTEGCTSVPGGKAQFEATLQPGGRIAITAVAGQPDVIPICVLKHSLTHSVPLAQPCHLDVKLEQTSVAMPVDGGS